MNKKILAIVAAALLLCVAVGGTVAWLQDSTETVMNTFTPNYVGGEEAAKMNIVETTTGTHTKDTEGKINHTTKKSYNIIPGFTDSKDPHVIIDTSVKAYVFLKVTATNVDKVTYSLRSEWRPLNTDENGKSTDGVYYQVKEAGKYSCENETDNALYILTNNQVSYANTLTNDDLKNMDENGTLTFQAWAIQYYKSNTATADDQNGTPFTAAEAWGIVNPPVSGT